MFSDAATKLFGCAAIVDICTPAKKPRSSAQSVGTPAASLNGNRKIIRKQRKTAYLGRFFLLIRFMFCPPADRFLKNRGLNAPPPWKNDKKKWFPFSHRRNFSVYSFRKHSSVCKPKRDTGVSSFRSSRQGTSKTPTCWLAGDGTVYFAFFTAGFLGGLLGGFGC